MKFVLSGQTGCFHLSFPVFDIFFILLLQSLELCICFRLFCCCCFGNFIQTPLSSALLFGQCMLYLGQTILGLGQLGLHILQMLMLLRHLGLQASKLQVHVSQLFSCSPLQLQVPVLHPLHLILMLCEAFLLCIRFFREIFLQLADLCLHFLFILLHLLFARFSCLFSTSDLLAQRFQSVECLLLFTLLCCSFFRFKLLVQSSLLHPELSL
mmetsp:Transcript_1427/g.2148  ORF Transcript_1427/g.2148 Transcript_1427/m.2148 type:complete len:211 (+) Transcript_1427:308-940(+)